MSESKNVTEIQLNIPKYMRLFRNNTGLCTYLKNGRKWKVKYGIGGTGGSDLIGFTQLKITQEMVGKEMAIFTAVPTTAIPLSIIAARSNGIRPI